jgi:peroxiredoxin
VDTKESPETIKKFLEKQPYTLPILLDKTGKMGRLFGVWAHPTTYIINRKGLVCYRAVGELDWTSLEATSVIELLLQEK